MTRAERGHQRITTGRTDVSRARPVLGR
jgi:hypothetical protein